MDDRRHEQASARGFLFFVWHVVASSLILPRESGGSPVVGLGLDLLDCVDIDVDGSVRLEWVPSMGQFVVWAGWH